MINLAEQTAAPVEATVFGKVLKFRIFRLKDWGLLHRKMQEISGKEASPNGGELMAFALSPAGVSSVLAIALLPIELKAETANFTPNFDNLKLEASVFDLVSQIVGVGGEQSGPPSAGPTK
jgi:hypothetical protein